MTAVQEPSTETAREIGRDRRRKEDQRLITGRTRWTDNIQLHGMLHMAMVRSPFAHATITSIDTSEAKNAPNVVAVYTGRDLDESAGALINAWPITPDQVTPAHLPLPADRVVIDVSGDGIDNCTEPDAFDAARDALLSAGATINGLPILVPGENDVVGAGAFRAPGYGLRPAGPGQGQETTLDGWYRAHVVGGPGSFLLAAQGYGDFARALRQKFVLEISALEPGRR